MTKRSELVLPPGTYAYSLDRSNAQLSVLVGPIQNKLEELEGTVTFDPDRGRTVGCPLERAIKAIEIVPAGSFATITNPYVVDGRVVQPPVRKKTQVGDIDLQYGRAVNIPGPTAVVPWPGQAVTVQEGYRLRQDQYLTVEIHDYLDDAGAKFCDDLGIARHGRQLIRGDCLPEKLSTSLFIPPTGMQVLGGKNPIEDALVLGPLDWCCLDTPEGDRYVRGPCTVFPAANETVKTFESAHDLRTCGLHLRTVQDGRIEERFLTAIGRPDVPPFYWPDGSETVLDVLRPIDIPYGGAVYLRTRGESEINVYDKAGPALFNPIEFELVERDGSAYVPVVAVQEGWACEMDSPDGTGYVVGPRSVLLAYNERKGRDVQVREHLVTCPLKALAADGVPVSADFVFTLELTGEPHDWFGTPDRKTATFCALQREFARVAAQVASTSLKPDLVDRLAGLEVPNVRIVDGTLGPIRIDDEGLAEVLNAVRRNDTLNNLTQCRQRQEAERRAAEEAHAEALDELNVKLANLQVKADAARQRHDADMELTALEHSKARQALLDEIAAAEMEREARRVRQELELKAEQDRLAREMLEAEARAAVARLEAIQPELIAAIRTSGAQASFAKVVQHLGPSSILHGIGLEDAIKRLIGNDAASSMLLTGTPATDKANGRSQRPSAE